MKTLSLQKERNQSIALAFNIQFKYSFRLPLSE